MTTGNNNVSAVERSSKRIFSSIGASLYGTLSTGDMLIYQSEYSSDFFCTRKEGHWNHTYGGEMVRVTPGTTLIISRLFFHMYRESQYIGLEFYLPSLEKFCGNSWEPHYWLNTNLSFWEGLKYDKREQE